jgi:hypothetical protein
MFVEKLYSHPPGFDRVSIDSDSPRRFDSLVSQTFLPMALLIDRLKIRWIIRSAVRFGLDVVYLRGTARALEPATLAALA